MRYVALTLSLFVCFFLISMTALSAQVTTATLYGVVRDSTASSLPGATVTVVNPATGLTREAVTDVSGEFALAPWLGVLGFIAVIVWLYGWLLKRSARSS